MNLEVCGGGGGRDTCRGGGMGVMCFPHTIFTILENFLGGVMNPSKFM
jgi:hypothetical protein